MANNGSILQVEDDADDVLFFSLAAEAVGITLPIRVARDGHRLPVRILTKAEKYASILPAWLSWTSNCQALGALKCSIEFVTEPVLHILPVLIHTSSDHPTDIHPARLLGATSYTVKSGEFSTRLSQAKQLKLWLLHAGPLPASPLWSDPSSWLYRSHQPSVLTLRGIGKKPHAPYPLLQ